MTLESRFLPKSRFAARRSFSSKSWSSPRRASCRSMSLVIFLAPLAASPRADFCARSVSRRLCSRRILVVSPDDCAPEKCWENCVNTSAPRPAFSREICERATQDGHHQIHRIGPKSPLPSLNGLNDHSGFVAGEATVKIPPSVSLFHSDFYEPLSDSRPHRNFLEHISQHVSS